MMGVDIGKTIEKAMESDFQIDLLLHRVLRGCVVEDRKKDDMIEQTDQEGEELTRTEAIGEHSECDETGGDHEQVGEDQGTPTQKIHTYVKCL